MRAGREVVDKVVDALKLSQLRAFSSEVDTGSREENASKQESRASVLIQSEPIMLQRLDRRGTRRRHAALNQEVAAIAPSGSHIVTKI
jgi:hypothetical protein